MGEFGGNPEAIAICGYRYIIHLKAQRVSHTGIWSLLEYACFQSLQTKSWIKSGQIIIFHQPRFPWNKGIPLTKPPFGVRSCEVAIIWPDQITLLCLFWGREKNSASSLVFEKPFVAEKIYWQIRDPIPYHASVHLHMFHDHSFRLYSLSQNEETDVSGLAKPPGKGWKSICYVLKDHTPNLIYIWQCLSIPTQPPCAIRGTSWAKKTWLLGMNLLEPRYPRLNCWNSVALTKLVLGNYLYPAKPSISQFISKQHLSNFQRLIPPKLSCSLIVEQVQISHISMHMWSPCWIAPPHPRPKKSSLHP